MEQTVDLHEQRTLANIDAWLDGDAELDLVGLRDYCCDRWDVDAGRVSDTWQGWVALAVSELGGRLDDRRPQRP